MRLINRHPSRSGGLMLLLLCGATVLLSVLLAFALKRRLIAECELAILATTDSLTGLYNIRELHRRLDAAFARSDRTTASISLLLIDFDHFKSVNDELGHQHGDLVLQLGARIARSSARGQDAVARYGGDELAILAADTTGIGAQRLRPDGQPDVRSRRSSPYSCNRRSRTSSPPSTTAR